MLDFRTSSGVQANTQRIGAILGSEIFTAQGSSNPLFLSALTELVIRVSDLVGKAAAAGKIIDFDDDVTKKGEIQNVRELIVFTRNAVCHISSNSHKLEDLNAWLSFNAQVGYGCFAQINGQRFECEYADDIAFFFGEHRIYLNRHLVRAFQEARDFLEPLLCKADRVA